MSSGSQHLTLLNNVNASGAGATQQWNGGPAVLMGWWDGGVYGGTVSLEVSPDGGSHWAYLCNITTSNNGQASWVKCSLPPCAVRGIVNGSAPNNMNLVLVGYDDAADVSPAS